MEEVNFPRGGRTVTPSIDDKDGKNHKKKKKSKKRTTPDTDFLFGTSTDHSHVLSSNHKKKKKKHTMDVKTSLLPLGGGGVVHPNHGEAWMESLSWDKLSKGVKLLGMVTHVYDELVLFSLPNQWTAYMMTNDTDIKLQVGQILAVTVVQAVQETTANGPKRRIQVSCLPSAVNPRGDNASKWLRGQVMSVQDHGLLVDLGWARQGFLRFDDIEGEYSVEDTEEETQPDSLPSRRLVGPGRILDVQVQSKTNDASKIVKLALPSWKHQMQQLLSGTPSLAQLQPGTLVQCKVERVIRNGLCISFGNGVFRGALETSQLGVFYVPHQRTESTEWKTLFETHRNFAARILAVDAATKLVRLSRLPHILEGRVPSDDCLPAVGTVATDCPVIRLDPGVGALLALPSDEEDEQNDEKEVDAPHRLFKPLSNDDEYVQATKVRAVYVHISKAMDKDRQREKTSESVFAKEFAPSTKHTIRVLGSSWMDGIATGASAPSIVSAHVLTHADLEPGQVYHDLPICAQLDGGGILVDFGMGVRGMVPPLHLFDQNAGGSDFRTKLLKTKYAVGAKVNVRVLSVDVANKRCLLTAKKSLVNDDGDDDTTIIKSFDGLGVGQRAKGFVSKVDDRGLSVTFFGGVYGRVTARSLTAELGVENHKENYSVGDVVSCRVVHIKKRTSNTTRRGIRDGDEDDDPSSKRRAYWELTLSLQVNADEGDNLIADDPETPDSAKQRQVRVQAGAILPLRSLRIVELVSGREKERGFVPGYAIVRIKSKYLTDEAENGAIPPFVECKLPYDQLLDEYDAEHIESAATLDALAEKLLTIGKKINREGLVLTDPRKSSAEYTSGTGKFMVVSIRPKLIKAAKEQLGGDDDGEKGSDELILPGPDTHLYQGAKLIGYVVQRHPKHGAFIRFLDGLTGLVPKLKGGLTLPLFGTVVTKIIALDVTTRPMKILLAKSRSSGGEDDDKVQPKLDLKVGDLVEEAEIVDLNFHRAKVKILDSSLAKTKKLSARVHYTMAESKACMKPEKVATDASKQIITSIHPFYGWKAGTKLADLTVVAIDYRGGTAYVELSNRTTDVDDGDEESSFPVSAFFENTSKLPPGKKVSGVVSSLAQSGGGLWIQCSPGVSGFLPALELSSDLDVLNNLEQYFPAGSRLKCMVLDRTAWTEKRSKLYGAHENKGVEPKQQAPFLSVLACEGKGAVAKPLRGDVIVGRINRKLPISLAPALMLDLRGGFVGRCCITELEEVDDWINMPLGRMPSKSDEALKSEVDDEELDEEHDDGMSEEPETDQPFRHGRFVTCRVLAGVPSKPLVETSLRGSRLEGDLDEDELPEAGETAQAYVVDTNKKGCFVRLARQIEGRVTLKELCDGFLPNPAASFPMGRLVVGKVKDITKNAKKKKAASMTCKYNVNLDMRESTLLDTNDKLRFEDLEIGGKYNGTVTRIEDYGVFVRIEKSDLSGLAHKSECSDNYVRDLSHLYDPGDLVKLLVIKKDVEKKQLGFSLKASHFEDDDDSEEDDSSIEEDMSELGEGEVDKQDDLDSDDENYASKLALQMEREAAEGELCDEATGHDERSNSESSSGSESSTSSSEDDGDDGRQKRKSGFDTNVGFDWDGATSNKGTKRTRTHDSDSSLSDEEDEDDEDAVHKSSHKSRRKQAQRRREEQEISRREIALADGTADENPETAGDFERLLAGNPNSSELWIRYMAFHLTLADVPAAREVAERAFERIEFRQEGEKLNVWTALLTLELKYGSADSLQQTIDRACQHNNPKQVYLRICEMMEKHDGTREQTDAMFEKMCKKFRDKKKVWIARIQHLLRTDRQEEAYAMSKRALQSLAPYKHVETMCKFAQLAFEYGNAERARTIFDGLLLKNPKRLDLFFVYVDKETKHGEIETARSLFHQAVTPQGRKMSDKQMKSLFKKWYQFEEQHGSDETRENVKNAARAYVERSNA